MTENPIKSKKSRERKREEAEEKEEEAGRVFIVTFTGKARQGLASSGLASLNNFSRLWDIRAVSKCFYLAVG